MPTFARLLSVVLIGATVGCAAGSAPGLPESEIALRVQGADLVNDAGEPVQLRAINLGNWLLLEMWMLAGQPVPDQQSFIDVLESRFGEAEADRLIGIYRDGWITQRDMDQIADAGFNAVRLPFSHLILESAPFVFDDEGFLVLRRAIDLAEEAGLFVILDMHQVPGGQSFDQPSGDITANNLWTDAEAQERLAWLWQNIARRVKNDRNVVAYDLINEPYSTFTDDIRPQLLSIVDRTIKAIREVDSDRLIYAPGSLQGIRFYGDPAARGWTNTGFTEHFYPGVFDWRRPTMGNYARFLNSELRDRAEYTRALGVPYLWGEFNPVFESAGAAGTVRDSLDTSAELGISAAVWSHKIFTPGGGVGDNNWYLVTNQNPFALTDITTAPKLLIEATFGSLATMPLAVDQDYFDILSDPGAARTLPVVPLPPFVPPTTSEWATWTGTDVGLSHLQGGHTVAGATTVSADSLTIYSAGRDIFGSSDSIRLISTQAPTNYAVSGVFDPFEGGQYAQAGVTVRGGTNSNAPHLSLVAFTDGRVVVKQRASTGGLTSERYLATTGFPAGLAVGRSGGSFVAWITDEDGQWRSVPLTENPGVGSQPVAGFFGATNRDGPLSVIEIQSPRIATPGALPPALQLDDGVNLLSNPSFEAGGTSPTSWSIFGGQLRRQTGLQPLRDGSALLEYRHSDVNSEGPQGAYQDIESLIPGEEYAFTVYANRDTVPPGRSLADAVELRIEEIGSPARQSEAAFFEVSEVATGSRWSRLQVRFTATKPVHRALIIAYPGSGNRDGSVKFDGVFLEQVTE